MEPLLKPMGAMQPPMAKEPVARGALSERVAQDPLASRLAEVMEETMQVVPEAVVQKLTDGKGDLELEIAETAGNMLRAEIQKMGEQFDEASMEMAAMAAISVLVEVAIEAGLLQPAAAKQLAKRALPMALHVAANGPGSVQ